MSRVRGDEKRQLPSLTFCLSLFRCRVQRVGQVDHDRVVGHRLHGLQDVICHCADMSGGVRCGEMAEDGFAEMVNVEVSSN